MTDLLSRLQLQANAVFCIERFAGCNENVLLLLFWAGFFFFHGVNIFDETSLHEVSMDSFNTFVSIYRRDWVFTLIQMYYSGTPN